MKCPGLVGVQLHNGRTLSVSPQKLLCAAPSGVVEILSGNLQVLLNGLQPRHRKDETRPLFCVLKSAESTLCTAGRRGRSACGRRLWRVDLGIRLIRLEMRVHRAGYRCRRPRPKHAESDLAALWTPASFLPFREKSLRPLEFPRRRASFLAKGQDAAAHLDSHRSQSVLMNCWLKTRSLSETPPAEMQQAESTTEDTLWGTASRHAVHCRSFLARAKATQHTRSLSL